ncbi:MAG: DUF4293 domain-containing protein [Chitinophagaceae bacterium]
MRIQSIWLLLAAITILSLLMINYGVLPSLSEVNASKDYVLMVFVLLAAIVSLFAVFLKDRNMQKKLIVVSGIITVGSLLWMLYRAYISKSLELIVGLVGNKLYLGAAMPVLACIFLFLAYRGVRSDEKLLRSADRLR